VWVFVAQEKQGLNVNRLGAGVSSWGLSCLSLSSGKKRKRRGDRKSGAARQHDARGKRKDNTGGNH